MKKDSGLDALIKESLALRNQLLQATVSLAEFAAQLQTEINQLQREATSEFPRLPKEEGHGES